MLSSTEHHWHQHHLLTDSVWVTKVCYMVLLFRMVLFDLGKAKNYKVVYGQCDTNGFKGKFQNCWFGAEISVYLMKCRMSGCESCWNSYHSGTLNVTSLTLNNFLCISVFFSVNETNYNTYFRRYFILLLFILFSSSIIISFRWGIWGIMKVSNLPRIMSWI